jgi:hypothetical protein
MYGITEASSVLEYGQRKAQMLNGAYSNVCRFLQPHNRFMRVLRKLESLLPHFLSLTTTNFRIWLSWKPGCSRVFRTFKPCKGAKRLVEEEAPRPAMCLLPRTSSKACWCCEHLLSRAAAEISDVIPRVRQIGTYIGKHKVENVL